MATTTTSRRTEVTAAGRPLLASAVVLVAYLVIALTVGADYEQDLLDAAERADVAVNEVASATQARIVQDHALYSVLTSLLLLVPPAFLLVAARRVRATGSPSAAWSWWTSLAAAVLWWCYVVLGLGLFADPDDLPPVVRDFGPLTVPVVTVFSLLATAAVALLGEAVRRAGTARRAGRVASVLAVLLGVLFVAGLVSSGYADPVPPIVIVPSALVLGVALVRAARRAPEALGAARR